MSRSSPEAAVTLDVLRNTETRHDRVVRSVCFSQRDRNAFAVCYLQGRILLCCCRRVKAGVLASLQPELLPDCCMYMLDTSSQFKLIIDASIWAE